MPDVTLETQTPEAWRAYLETQLRESHRIGLNELAMGGYIRSDRKAIRRDRDLGFDHSPQLNAPRGKLAGYLADGERQMMLSISP
jgi:hypothetical protein